MAREGPMFGDALMGMDSGVSPKVISNFMRMAVVCDVLFEPGNLDEETRFGFEEGLLRNLSDENIMHAIPRNSITYKEISGGAGRKSAKDIRLAFPLFAPHLMMPVKAGETVWIFDPTPDQRTDVVFWVCRIPTLDFVDDVNFTHHDRILTENYLKQEVEEGEEKEEVPGFPNGRPPDITLGPPVTEPDDSDPFDIIASQASSNRATTYEPVPRFTPRPGDMVLQGSNNALICLGQDRGFTHPNAPTKPTRPDEAVMTFEKGAKHDILAMKEDSNRSNAFSLPNGDPSGVKKDKPRKEEADAPTGKGTIDIVAGRGRAAGTKSLDIENEREWKETNKNPVYYGNADAEGVGEDGEWGNLAFNPSEGDPDFYKDSSRVYVSMKTDGDNNFGLTYPGVPASTAGDFVGVDVEAVAGKPYVVLKSDEIRIIARQDDDTETQGSIKIVKEGTPDDEKDGKGRAVIMLNRDGTIMIDGPKIVIGSGASIPGASNAIQGESPKDNGEGHQVSFGLGATEPTVLGQILLDKLIALEQAFNDHIHSTGTGPSTKHHDAGAGPGTESIEFEAGVDGDNAEPPGKAILSKIGKTL